MQTYATAGDDQVTAAHDGVRAALSRLSLDAVIRPRITFTRFDDARRSVLYGHEDRPELVLDARLSPVQIKHAAAREMRRLYHRRRGSTPTDADVTAFANQVTGRSGPAVSSSGAASLAPVKALSETATAYRLGGYAVVWGGQDLMGQHFGPDTRFWDGAAGVPVLYQHGMDPAVGKAVLGRVVAQKTDDFGLWVEMQIDKAAQYARAVMDLVRRGVLGLSSGSVAHLVEIAGDGKILSWPIAEVSVTNSPAEPRTLGVRELAEVRALAGGLR